MFTFPEFDSRLNFESIRCELKGCCRQSQQVVRDRLDPLLDRLTGPEQQLFSDDARQVQVSLKWLSRRVQTFRRGERSTRDDWDQLVAEATEELELLQRRVESIEEAARELLGPLAENEQSTSEVGEDCSENVTENAEENGTECAEKEVREADVNDEELCCC